MRSAGEDGSGRAAGWWIGLLALAAGGAYLRFTAVMWGAPYGYHPDEHFVVHHALDMLSSGDPNPRWFQYPSLLIYLQALLAAAMQPFVQAPLETNYLANGIGPWDILPAQWPFLAAGRLLVAAGGVTGALLLAVTGARLISRPAGVLAGAFLLAAPLHNESSHYLATDVPATTLLIASLLAGAARRWMLAGLLAGLAASTKYTAGLAILPAAVWALHAAPGERPAANLSHLTLGAIAGFFLGTPYALLDAPAFWQGLMAQRQNYLGGHLLGNNGRHYMEYLYNYGLGSMAALMAGLGVVRGVGRMLDAVRRREAMQAIAVLVLPPLLYIPWLASYPARAERNLIVVLPFLCLAAAEMTQRVALVARNQRARRLLFAALGAVAVFGSAQVSADFNARLAWPDTRSQAMAWIEANLGPGTKIAREEYTPQVPNGPYDVTYVWSLARQPYDWYLANRVQYMVASSNVFGRSLGPPHLGGEAAKEFYRVLFTLPLEAEFRPGDRASGPTIRIYKVPLPASGPRQ